MCNCLQQLDDLRLRHEADPNNIRFFMTEFDDANKRIATWGHEITLHDYIEAIVATAKRMHEELDGRVGE